MSSKFRMQSSIDLKRIIRMLRPPFNAQKDHLFASNKKMMSNWVTNHRFYRMFYIGFIKIDFRN